VQGRLQYSSWEQEGKKRSKVEVNAHDVTFLDSRGASGEDSNDSGPSSASKPQPTKKKDDVVIEDIGDQPINLDDIPF